MKIKHLLFALVLLVVVSLTACEGFFPDDIFCNGDHFDSLGHHLDSILCPDTTGGN